MIFYSIVPLEYVMKEDVLDNSMSARLIDYKGCKVEVISNNGITKVNRIISTSPKDFLSNELQPGTIINDSY